MGEDRCNVAPAVTVEASTIIGSWAPGEGCARRAAFDDVSFKWATTASWTAVRCRGFQATLTRALKEDMIWAQCRIKRR